MEKNKKKITIIVIAIVVVVGLAVGGVVCWNVNKSSNSGAKTTNVSKNKESKAWDDVVVVEETTMSKKDKQVLYKRNKKGEIVTKKSGEKVTRKSEYAGEDEGWSPIVSPDDLKKDKKK